MLELLTRLAQQKASVELMLINAPGFWGPYTVTAVGRGEPAVLICTGSQDREYLINVDHILVVRPVVTS